MDQDDFIPVHGAVRLILERLERPAGPPRPPDLVDGIANLLCVFTTLYAHEDGRPLSRYELVGGAFREGGREMIFPDGRPKLTGLAVRGGEIDALVERFARLGIIQRPTFPAVGGWR